MSAITLHIEGFDFAADTTEDEPRVLDVQLAEKAGLSRPTNIRQIIKTAIADGFLREGEHFRVCTPAVQTPKGGRPTVSYELTETGALKLVTRMNTPAAHAMVDVMVRVYRQAIRMLHAPPSAPAPALPFDEAVNRYCSAAVRISEHPVLFRQVRDKIRCAAIISKVSRQRIAGRVRRVFRTTSEYAILVANVDLVFSLLDEVISGRVAFTATGIKLLPLAAPRQRALFDN